jgi:uncharacterized protein (DUF983 family)
MPQDTAQTARSTATPEEDRPMKTAILRGLRCRCPNCGKGKLLTGYLTVRASCAVCGEDYTAQRADDGPAYLTILVVGHLMAPLMLAVFVAYRPSPMGMMLGFGIGCVALTLALLPRFKGLIVAIQWSRRMHGFGLGEANVA